VHLPLREMPCVAALTASSRSQGKKTELPQFREGLYISFWYI
jgi:hypothetical protein